jgi:hypothetical protein
MPQKPVLERAYEIARSGACPNLEGLRAQLKAERYGNDFDRHASGSQLRKDLRRICAAATSAPPNVEFGT